MLDSFDKEFQKIMESVLDTGEADYSLENIKICKKTDTMGIVKLGKSLIAMFRIYPDGIFIEWNRGIYPNVQSLPNFKITTSKKESLRDEIILRIKNYDPHRDVTH